MRKGDALPIVPCNMNLMDALSVLTSKGCGCVLVTDVNDCLAGIITDGDIRRAIQSFGEGDSRILCFIIYSCSLTLPSLPSMLALFSPVNNIFLVSFSSYAGIFKRTASEIMTVTCRFVTADIKAVDALETMEHGTSKRVSALPVVTADTKNVEGLLLLHDLVERGLL